MVTSSPARAAAAAAAARVGCRSFARMFATWRCTVCGLITRRSAICASLSPRATSPSTSRSRAAELTAAAPVSAPLAGAGGPSIPRNGATARRTASPSPCHGRWASPGSVTRSALREQRGHLACAFSRIARSCSRCTTSAGARIMRQLVAHVGLVDQREQVGGDFGVGGGALEHGEGGPVLG